MLANALYVHDPSASMIKPILSTENEIKRAYQDKSGAAAYVHERFSTELTLLLHERQVAVVKKLVTGLESGQLLEIAPGPGRITRDIPPIGSLICLEYNEVMIQLGRTACDGRRTWIRGNGFELPFARVFDLVYSFRFVRHFHQKDRERFYRGVRDVLKPRGYFVMDAVNKKVAKRLRDTHPENYPIYDKLYRLEELRQELCQAGFEPIEIQPVQKFYRWQYRSQILIGPRANWLNRLVIRGLERLPSADGLEWIVTCRRA